MKDKKVLLGISGGIAAFKIPALVRLFVKEAAEVRVVMTPNAKDFVTPLTLSTLSNNPVLSDFFDQDTENKKWNNHVELALWADFMLIAPATASTLSKMASGNSDNFLLATYLSAKCPVYFAPAMDLDMYKHPATISNFKVLEKNGNIMIPAESGELASGLYGQGRMAEPESIFNFIKNNIETKLPLRGKKILVTAGPTYEVIDPVRFIGNHSSGKMGFDIADCASNLGAEVTLVSGPTHCKIKNNSINLVPVVSAEEMFQSCSALFPEIDVFIAAAAVADYKPKTISPQKIKKEDATQLLELEKTIDILSCLGKNKKNQFIVGFALETENEIENAKSKIQRKNLDLIVLNSLNDIGAGFGKSTNKVTFIDKSFKITKMDLKSKEEVAEDIMQKIMNSILI